MGWIERTVNKKPSRVITTSFAEIRAKRKFSEIAYCYAQEIEMSWQVFLTLWLCVQMIGNLCSQVSLNKLRKENELHLMASIVGVVMKFLGIFACLYFGEFYAA